MKNTLQTQGSEATKLFLRREMQTIFAITLIAVMGVASLTPAFPRIKEAFNINNHQVGFLITVFTLPGIFFESCFGHSCRSFWSQNHPCPFSAFVCGKKFEDGVGDYVNILKPPGVNQLSFVFSWPFQNK